MESKEKKAKVTIILQGEDGTQVIEGDYIFGTVIAENEENKYHANIIEFGEARMSTVSTAKAQLMDQINPVEIMAAKMLEDLGLTKISKEE